MRPHAPRSAIEIIAAVTGANRTRQRRFQLSFNSTALLPVAEGTVFASSRFSSVPIDERRRKFSWEISGTFSTASMIRLMAST
jgi:hypothetical protein